MIMQRFSPLRAADGANSGPLPSPSVDGPLIIAPAVAAVVFPRTVFPVSLVNERAIAAIQAAVREERPIGLLMQRHADAQAPGAEDLHRIGTVCNILRYLNAPDGTHHAVLQGVQRFEIRNFLSEQPYFVAEVLRIEDVDQESPAIEAARLHLQRLALETLQLVPQVPAELVQAVQTTASPSALADLVATYLDVPPNQKQEILETLDAASRVEKVSKLLAHQVEVLRISNEIGRQTKQTFDEREREAVLREQLASIQRQLGEGDGQGRAQEVAELRGESRCGRHARGHRGKRPQGAAALQTQPRFFA